MLTSDCRCKTLDTSADGYARSEYSGCGFLSLLERASSIPKALVRGWTVNQDGRSSSLTSPNGPAQLEMLQDALAFARLSAESLSMLGMHGTGTALGDPIEIGSIGACVGRSSTSAQYPIIIMASKSFHGHAEAASGSISMWAALECSTVSYHTGILHLRRMNPYCCNHFGESRLAASRSKGALLKKGTIGISAFAFQGTNAFGLLQPHYEQTTIHDHASTIFLLKIHDSLRYLSPWPYWCRTCKENITFLALPGRSFVAETMDHKATHSSLFPAAGLCEAFDAALLQTMSEKQANYAPSLLTRVSFLRPLLLLLLSSVKFCDTATGKISGSDENLRKKKKKVKKKGEERLMTEMVLLRKRGAF